MNQRNYESEAKAIVDQAMAELIKIATDQYNEICPCGKEHELAPSAWGLVYEYVDMSERADPMAAITVLHSPNSYSHAAGMLVDGAGIIRMEILGPFGKESRR